MVCDGLFAVGWARSVVVGRQWAPARSRFRPCRGSRLRSGGWRSGVSGDVVGEEAGVDRGEDVEERDFDGRAVGEIDRDRRYLVAEYGAADGGDLRHAAGPPDSHGGFSLQLHGAGTTLSSVVSCITATSSSPAPLPRGALSLPEKPRTCPQDLSPGSRPRTAERLRKCVRLVP